MVFWKTKPEILYLLSEELHLREVFLLQHYIPQVGVGKNARAFKPSKAMLNLRQHCLKSSLKYMFT